jgi:Flp pilus assembly protein TadD
MDPKRKFELTNQLVKTHVKFAREAISASGDASYHFVKAIRLAPQSAPLRHEYGVHLANTEQYDKAESQFRELIRLRPNSATAKQSLKSLLRKKSELRGTR